MAHRLIPLTPPLFFHFTLPLTHKIRINKEYTVYVPSPRWNWDSPNPSLASECAPPPQEPGGGSGINRWA